MARAKTSPVHAVFFRGSPGVAVAMGKAPFPAFDALRRRGRGSNLGYAVFSPPGRSGYGLQAEPSNAFRGPSNAESPARFSPLGGGAAR